jgi:hypothetical protein
VVPGTLLGLLLPWRALALKRLCLLATQILRSVNPAILPEKEWELHVPVHNFLWEKVLIFFF